MMTQQTSPYPQALFKKNKNEQTVGGCFVFPDVGENSTKALTLTGKEVDV